MLIFTMEMQNHGNSQKSQHKPEKATMIDIVHDTDNIDPSLLCDLCPWLTVSQVAIAGPQLNNM